MLIMKVDYKNVNKKVSDKFVKHMKQWLHISINEYWVDYEAFPTFLTITVKNNKDAKVIEDVVNVFVKRNNIDVLECINACPSGNNGIYKTIIFNQSEPKANVEESTYADAVKAICDILDLMSHEKFAILSWLEPGLDSDIYQAIINVAESDMTAILKEDTMIDIAKKASSIMGNK